MCTCECVHVWVQMPQGSRRVTHTLNHWVISPAPLVDLLREHQYPLITRQSSFDVWKLQRETPQFKSRMLHSCEWSSLIGSVTDGSYWSKYWIPKCGVSSDVLENTCVSIPAEYHRIGKLMSITKAVGPEEGRTKSWAVLCDAVFYHSPWQQGTFQEECVHISVLVQ